MSVPDNEKGSEPVSLAPLTPEEALRALLAVKPTGPPEDEKQASEDDEQTPAD